MKSVVRCAWVDLSKPYYVEYHDKEWGVPVHDDQHHFEMLILEGAQAGLSWDTVLKKREGYRSCFFQFDPEKVVKMKDKELETLLEDPRIIRNRLKVFSTRDNAKVFLQIQKEFGFFDTYVWNFVENKPICKHHKTIQTIPAKTKESDLLSKDLKKRGMNFVGSTIVYAYMQAVGMVNDHTTDCFCFKIKK